MDFLQVLLNLLIDISGYYVLGWAGGALSLLGNIGGGVLDYVGQQKANQAKEKKYRALSKKDYHTGQDLYGDGKNAFENEKLSPTAFNNFSPDSQAVSAQRSALDQINQYTSPTRTAQEDANYRNTLQNAVGAQKSIQNTVLNNQNNRGLSGGGNSLAAGLSGASSAANTVAGAGLASNANMTNRAINAINQKNQFASNLRGQDFNEQATKASAVDAFNTADWQNRQSQRNIRDNRNLQSRDAKLDRQWGYIGSGASERAPESFGGAVRGGVDAFGSALDNIGRRQKWKGYGS